MFPALSAERCMRSKVDRSDYLADFLSTANSATGPANEAEFRMYNIIFYESASV